jgi:glycogen synthase
MMTYSSDYGRWKLLVNTIMRQDWGWNGPAETYVEHYWQAKKKHLTNPNVND